jgi:hypothetical protein
VMTQLGTGPRGLPAASSGGSRAVRTLAGSTTSTI